jgi:hypothetical protein
MPRLYYGIVAKGGHLEARQQTCIANTTSKEFELVINELEFKYAAACFFQRAITPAPKYHNGVLPGFQRLSRHDD